jgi:hypothetical protein
MKMNNFDSKLTNSKMNNLEERAGIAMGALWGAIIVAFCGVLFLLVVLLRSCVER